MTDPSVPFPTTPQRERERLVRPASGRALRHRSSDYVVLPRVDGPSHDVSLPRPRFWYLLILFGLLDAACTVAFLAYNRGVDSRDQLGLIGWGCFRAVTVVLAASTIRIRETGWVFVGSALISALASLADLNLLIQTRTWTASIPASSVLYCVTHLFFGVLHWLAFAGIVGVSKERNPYGLGLRSARQPVWREGVVDVEFERSRGNIEEPEQDTEAWQGSVQRKRWLNEASFESDAEDGEQSSDDEDDRPIDERDAYLSDAETGGEDEGHEDTEEGTGSEHDPNDIIDIIPSPSVGRHRTISQSHSHRSMRNRRSFYRHASGSSPEDTQQSPIENRTSRYGTFSNLAGI